MKTNSNESNYPTLKTNEKMSRPVKQNYPSPIAGYEGAPPLSEERNDDGKSFVNPKREGLSDTYQRFADPLDNGRRGGL